VADIKAIRSSDLRPAIRLTADRVLVRKPSDAERKSKSGLLIPATAASVNRRGIWSEVVAVGPNVRNIEVGDQVLHLPDSGIEVDIRGEDFVMLRERDIHAIASDRADAGTGLYL
jgi:chaperonin GroES